MRNNPQCQTCVFNAHEFNAFCEKNEADEGCLEYCNEVTKRCDACQCLLHVSEWFNFGNKCAICAIQD